MRYSRPESMGYIHDLKDIRHPKGFVAEYKYNGWAVGITPTMIETRHGNPLPAHVMQSIKGNLARLREMIEWDYCDMVHAELMCLTPNVCPKDTFIVHDCMGGCSEDATHYDRTMWMWKSTPQIFHGGNFSYGVGPNWWLDEQGDVWLPKRVKFYEHDHHLHCKDAVTAIKQQVRINTEAEQLFYEGFVYKRASAHYGAKNAWFKQRIQNQILKERKIYA